MLKLIRTRSGKLIKNKSYNLIRTRYNQSPILDGSELYIGGERMLLGNLITEEPLSSAALLDNDYMTIDNNYINIG